MVAPFYVSKLRKHHTQLNVLDLSMAEVNGKDDNHKVESGEMKKMEDDQSASKSERQKTPYQKANFLSRMAFHWMQPVASKGKAGKLTEDDLMLAESEESNFCYDQFIKNWNKELTKEKHP